MQLLLVHTGGTIGMASTDGGLAPISGLVEDAVAARLAGGAEGGLHRHVFEPLLDSADVGPGHWNEMLDVIRAHPDMPTIVTHGTDTMAFTGAALSQALAGEGRRVILCGSMQPLGQGGDAEGNLDLAIAASRETTAGVFLAFAGKLLPAEGLVKHASHQADAFRVQQQAPSTPPVRRRFENRRLAILTLSPGIPAAMVDAAMMTLDGAVLRLFGSGTAMADPELLRVLAKAVANGKRLRGVSQCEAGGLSPGSYAAGAGLWATGIENGGSETPEAALVRLWLN